MAKASVAQSSLATYRAKRDFAKTSEPARKKAVPSSAKLRFVIQRHDATRLHYDFRLELDGVLKSWAVPKGPSTNPKDKRLAIQTEDHPLEYASFEGTIPEGQYGAGTVIVWDTGSYKNMSKKDGLDITLAQALENGHAAIWLEGKILSGGYALTRTPRGWLLVKMRDEKADAKRDILKESPGSVL